MTMPTMLDVAKRAGVALSTVSYALTGTRPVSEATRLRIFAAMEELGYHPNLMARSLSTKRSRIIGLLIPSDMHGALDVMQSNFVASAVRVASRRSYGLLVWTLPEEEFDVRRMIQEGMVEGLLLMEVKLHDERVAKLRSSSYPFALIGHCAENAGISYVDFDFAAALRLAVQHLAELGHTSIAFVNFAEHALAAGYGPAVRSTGGFHAAVAEFGITGFTLVGPSAGGGSCRPRPRAPGRAAAGYCPHRPGSRPPGRRAPGRLSAEAAHPRRFFGRFDSRPRSCRQGRAALDQHRVPF